MLSNKVILQQMIESKALGKPTADLLVTYEALIERQWNKPNWCGMDVSFERVRLDALSLLDRVGLNFKPELSSNPFAYFSQAIHSSF